MDEVPHEALDLCYNSGGFFPDIGLYQRGCVFYHAPSRSHFWLFGVLLIGAIVVACLPFHTQAAVGELKYWIAGMLLFGGLCDLFGTFLQRTIRQQVLIDAKTLSIEGSGLMNDQFKRKLAWDQIVELQICRQIVADDSELSGYQLILVWREANGGVQRRCLLKHAVKTFVVRLGRRYQSLFGFTVTDYTRGKQQYGKANAA